MSGWALVLHAEISFMLFKRLWLRRKQIFWQNQHWLQRLRLVFLTCLKAEFILQCTMVSPQQLIQAQKKSWHHRRSTEYKLGICVHISFTSERNICDDSNVHWLVTVYYLFFSLEKYMCEMGKKMCLCANISHATLVIQNIKPLM